MGIFDNAVSVVIGNKIVESIVTSDNGVIYQKSEHTRLSIDVPLNLVYSDAFNITGHLTTTEGTGISGEEVVLKVGDTVMDSTTTTNNGEYSFTQTPVAIGNHSFQVVYAGSNTYGSSESSVVTREVGKETLVLTATFDKSKYDVGDTVNITFDLTDDEGNHRPYATIRVNNTNFTYTHAGIRPNKTYSFTYTENTSNIIQCVILGTQNYTGASVTLNLNTVTPTAVALSSDPLVTHGNTTTITATLQDQDGDGIANRELNYVVKTGSKVLYRGSDTTDSNGEIDINYTGTARGKIDVIASYQSLSQATHSLMDCWWYDVGTTSTHKNTWVVSDNETTSISYSTNGTTVTKTDDSSTWRYLFYDDSALSSTKVGSRYTIPVYNTIEFDVTAITGTVGLDMLSNSSDHPTPYISATGHYKIVLDNDTAVLYKDDTLIDTYVLSGENIRFGFSFNSVNESITFKNFVIYCPPQLKIISTPNVVGNNESTTITVKFVGGANANKNINYSFKHDDIILNEGTTQTDSDGLATLSYTGSELGKITVTAKYLSLLETTHEIYDSLFYDKGLSGTGNYNDNWTSPSNKVTCQRTSTGSVLTMGAGLTWGYWYVINNSTKFQCPIKIEYDLVNIVDTPKIRFNNGTTNQGHTFSETGHYEWTITLDTVSLKIDGVTKQNWITLDRTGGLIVYFELDADTDGLTYKNFKIYYNEPSIKLSSSNDVITSSETATITAKLVGVPYASKTLNYQVKHNDTVLDSGTTTTNSSGVATFSYTGIGVGEVDVEVSYNGLEATYEITDAHYYDTFNTNTATRYSINTASGNSLSVSNGEAVYTSGTASRYVRLQPSRTQSTLNIEDLVGKTFKFKANIRTTVNVACSIICQTPTDTPQVNGDTISSDGLLEVQATIPSDATNVIFNINTGKDNVTIYILDWLIYPV